MVSSESSPSSESALAGPAIAEGPLTIGFGEPETDTLVQAREILLERSDVTVVTVDESANGAEALADLHCLVRPPPGDEDRRAAPEVRGDGPSLPVVVVGTADALAAVGDYRQRNLETWASQEPADRLVGRIRLLVAHDRLQKLARRAMDALESTSDGMALVAPDGTITYANRLFAQTFGAATDDVVGRRWQELYADGEVERLESEALSAVDEGWRWIGTCQIRGLDGETATVQTSITGAADGSLVFSVYRRSERE